MGNTRGASGLPDGLEGAASRASGGNGSPAGACPRCSSTGFELVHSQDGVPRARRCRCLAAGRTEQLYGESRIPRRYRKCSFDSFAELNPSLALAKAQVKSFVDGYPIHDRGLLLLGACGVGKTHLAASALSSLIRDKGVRGLFYDFRDLLKEIQSSYDSVSQVTEMGVLQPIFGAEVMVLDDLGAAKMTDWVRDTLSYIMNVRYNERRVTLLTSNLDDEALGSKVVDERVRERPDLRAQIGDALRSRLYEMCDVVKLEGDDFRRTVAKHSGRGRGSLG